MEADLSTVFERARVGRVLVVFSNDVGEAVRAVQGHAESLVPVPTFVQLQWERAPALTRELKEIERALAEAVSSVWPGWHRSANERFEHRKFPQAERELLLAEAQRSVPHLSVSWFREAFAKCAAGHAPLIEGMALAEQVHQLTLALDPVRPLFCLSVGSEEASEARVHGLARAAEWLAKQSQAPVLLFVPHVWLSRASLDPVNYEAVELLFEALPLEPVLHVPSAGIAADTVEAERLDAQESPADPSGADRAGPEVSVFPLPGKPRSESERLLLELLQTDPHLGSLFELGVRIIGFGGKPYVVDFVWQEGGLVIEVDGEDHRREHKYAADRDRDYRLYLAGYVTLRVTNAEVFYLGDEVLEKIHKMVQSRANRPPPTSDFISSPPIASPQTAKSRRKKSSPKKRNSA